MGGRRRIFCLTMKFMLLSALCLTPGCRLISPYDHHAYTQTVSLKVESMFLMGKARDDCAKHKDAIENLSIKIETAYEYEKGRHKNEDTAEMWITLKDPDGALLGEFIRLWEKQGKLSERYIAEKKKQVGQAFDEIIGLETGKPKPSK